MPVAPSLSPQPWKSDPNPGPLSAAILMAFGGFLIWLGYVIFGEGPIRDWLVFPAIGTGFILLGLNHVWITVKKHRKREKHPSEST